MKLLLLILIVGGGLIMPFVLLKRPWALRLWRRIRLIVFIYVLVIVLSAVVRLVFNWNDIYG
jgi:hypothetical protein